MATVHVSNGATQEVEDLSRFDNVGHLADNVGPLENNTLKVDGVALKRSDPIPHDAKVIELISSSESESYSESAPPREREPGTSDD
jgi:hypothetical protein